MTTKAEAEVWQSKLAVAEIITEVARTQADSRWADGSPLGWGVRSIATAPYWCGPLYTNLEDLPPFWARIVLAPEEEED